MPLLHFISPKVPLLIVTAESQLSSFLLSRYVFWVALEKPCLI